MATPANKLTPEEEQKALERIQENKIRQASTREYVEDVKNSMLFQPGFNWDDELSAAPASVSLLGSLFVASTIPDAADITIIPPKGGFKHLDNFDKPALNTCLVQCSDKGAEAFGIASTSFGAITLNSGTVKQTVNQIIGLLGNKAEARLHLVSTVKTLAEVATASEESAASMEKAFQEWVDMVCELHACVVQTSTDKAEKLKANQIHLAAEQTRLSSTKEAKELARKSVNTLQGSLTTATNAYKKAADEFPSSWDLILQQLVSNLGECATSAISQATPALIQNYSMPAKLEAAMDIFKGDKGGAQGGSIVNGNVDNSKVTPATRVPSPIPRATIPYANDAAYGIIGPIRIHVGTILSFVTGGPDRGVDWKLLTSTDPNKQKNGVAVLATLMQDAENDFKPSSNPPSMDLQDVFAKTKIVTDGLQAAIKAHEALNGPPLPGPDSKEVKQWQEDMQVSSAKAVQLETASKTLTTASSPPLVKQAKATSSPTDKNGALRQQIIDAATTRLQMTAKVMDTVTEQYQKSSENLVHIQEKIGDIQADVASLNATDMSLEKIRAILVKSIEILVQLKTQIKRLVCFFRAINTLVDHAVKNEVIPFIRRLNDPNGEDEPSMVGFSALDARRQTIFSYSLCIRAYFDLFREIALMYMDVDNKYIRKGLEMVDDMQTEYNGADAKEKQQILTHRNNQVTKYTKSCFDGVKTLVRNKQVEITNSLQSNAASAADSLGFVSVGPTHAVAKAITAATEASLDAAKKGIAHSGKYISIQLNDTTSLEDDS